MQLILTLLALAGGILTLISGVAFHKKIFVQASGVLLIMVGCICVVGYATKSPNVYTIPPGSTGMALSTGICFSIIGCCLLILSNEIVFKKK